MQAPSSSGCFSINSWTAVCRVSAISSLNFFLSVIIRLRVNEIKVGNDCPY